MSALKIIIVEDDEQWLNLIRDRIDEALQHSTVLSDPFYFSTYNRASSALLNNTPWHLLITDYSLREHYTDDLGVELCHKANQLGIPSIVISGKPHVKADKVRELFIKHQVLDFYWKGNFDRDEFSKTVRREIEKTAGAKNTILSHFNTTDGKESIATFIEKSNTKQLYEICNVLELLTSGNEPESDLNGYLDSTQKVFETLHDKLSHQNKEPMAAAVKKIRQLAGKPDLNIKHRVKLTVPIIPFFVTYQGELDKHTKIKLKELWKGLVDRFKRYF